MCGIVGYIARHRSVAEQIIQSMCSQIVHRGPDDEGILCRGNAGIGMRRLSIIDLPGGHQPISNEHKTLHIVFNGEVYNFKELRKDLQLRGHNFSTQSDTEVVIHQYEEDGSNCLKKLNGMFAFALWDSRKGEFLIARDRLGIKPLYYYYDDDRFLFASEIKSLLVKEGVVRELNHKAVWDYLTFRYIPEPDTIWKGIRKLEPGHWLRLDINSWKTSKERYWDIPYGEDSAFDKMNDEEYLEEFSFLFEDSVSRHLRADVPVGILLSGGLDSSAVLAATSMAHQKEVVSFSVAFKDGGEFSELNYAREISHHLGVRNHEVIIDHREFIDFLNDFVWYTDEPLADLASIPLYYVSRLASNHVKVVLSGEGSDEVLGGYSFDSLLRKIELIEKYQKLPYWIRKAILEGLSYIGKNASLGFSNIINAPIERLPKLLNYHMTHYYSEEEKKALFSATVHFPDSLGLIRNYYDRVTACHPLNQIMYAFSQSWLVEDLLMKADKMTMANSIELRVPFLDYRIVEWAAKAPVWIKVGKENGKFITKRILRQYCHGKIPDSIIERKKQGFPVPAYKWLERELKFFAEDLFNGNCGSIDIFDRNIIDKIVKRGISKEAKLMERHKLWLLIILELWYKRWMRNE